MSYFISASMLYLFRNCIVTLILNKSLECDFNRFVEILRLTRHKQLTKFVNHLDNSKPYTYVQCQMDSLFVKLPRTLMNHNSFFISLNVFALISIHNNKIIDRQYQLKFNVKVIRKQF